MPSRYYLSNKLKTMYISYCAIIIFVFINFLSIENTFAQTDSFSKKVTETKISVPTNTVVHPQTPHAPYPYDTVEVAYDNADKTVHLAGTFSYPKKGESFTTIVMITGSGQQDRDETILGHKPFAVIADYLTRAGYAVLRVDDRGKGKSKGDLNKATSFDFANDVMTSVQYISNYKQVNKNKIGLIGHSEGGFIAPIIYTKYPGISFIVSLAGTGVPGADILFKQQTLPVKGLVSDEAYKAYENLTSGTLKLIQENYTLTDTLVLAKIKSIFTQWKKDLPDSILKPLNAKDATPEQYCFQVMIELRPWFRYFIATNPDDFWSKVKCPVLVLNGEKDIQVYPEQNPPAIAASLNKANNKNYEVKIFPGLNHLFQHCTKCTVSEYGSLDETFSPEVLAYIKDWLEKKVK